MWTDTRLVLSALSAASGGLLLDGPGHIVSLIRQLDWTSLFDKIRTHSNVMRLKF